MLLRQMLKGVPVWQWLLLPLLISGITHMQVLRASLAGSNDSPADVCRASVQAAKEAVALDVGDGYSWYGQAAS